VSNHRTQTKKHNDHLYELYNNDVILKKTNTHILELKPMFVTEQNKHCFNEPPLHGS